METKHCKYCNATKPISEFGIRSNGYARYKCKACRCKDDVVRNQKLQNDSEYIIKNQLKLLNSIEIIILRYDNKFRCNTCNAILDLSFKAGPANKCKCCINKKLKYLNT